MQNSGLNNTASASTGIGATDVFTTVSVPATALAGVTVSGTFLFGNLGANGASGVTYAATIGSAGNFPAAVNFTSLPTGVTAVYNNTNGQVAFTGMPSNLASGFNLSFGFSYTAPASGTIPVNTSISTVSSDANPANNTDSGSTTILPVADLSITKTDGVTSVTAGGAVSYTIVVSNGGPSGANNAIFTDPAVSNLTVTGVTCGSATGSAVCPAVGSTTVALMQGAGIVIPTLPSGGSVTFSVTGTAGASGSIVNVASIAAPSGTTDPTPGNNSATDTDTINPSADLDITKTGPGSATKGSNLTFTISVANHGPSDATNVVVTDPTPEGLSFVSATAPCSGGFPCTVGTISSGSTVGFTVTHGVPAGYAGPDPIVNAAAVSSDVPDPDPTNNDDRSSTPVDRAGQADLAVTKIGPVSAALGSTVTYQLVVMNNGPDDAVGVSLADPTPAGLIFVSADAPCAAGFPCALGNVNAGNSVAVNVTFAIPGSYTGVNITNTVTVTSTTTDPVPGNNTNTATTPIGAETVDLEVVKTGPALVELDGDVTYQIVVTNNGPGAATGVVLADPTPAGLTFVSATAPCGVGFPCGLGNLAAGRSITVSVTFHVPPGYNGLNPIVNVATVSGNEPDAKPANNTDSAATGVGTAAADLSVVKTGASIGVPGRLLTFQIVVTNNGPGAATNIVLADPTPAGLTFVSASDPCTGGFPCNLGTLVNGSSIAVSVTYQIPVDYTVPDPIENIATVSASEPDGNPTNNTDNALVGINNIADLSITKTDGVATYTPGGTTTYTIVVSNGGPSDVTGAAFTDNKPSQVTSWTWSCVADAGASCTAGPSTSSANYADSVSIPSGKKVTYTVVATLGSSASGNLVNTASIAAPGGVTDPTPGNNSAMDTDTINPSADLSITKTDGVTSVTAGGAVTYTIVVSNGGPSGANGAVFTDPAVSNLTVTGVTCGSATGSAACPAVGSTTVALMQGTGIVIPTLPSGGSVTFSVTGTAGASGSIVNVASIATPSGTSDPTPGNNSATDTDTITSQPDLTITKTHTGSFMQGQTGAQYTVTVTNSGSGAVTGTVSVTESAPSGLTVTAMNGTGWNCTQPAGPCTRSDGLGIGNSYSSITVTVNVASNAGTPLTNTASVSLAGQSESNTNNNTATDPTPITTGGPNLYDPPNVTKTVDGNGLPVLRYTAVLINSGNGPALGVVFTDNIPQNTTYVSDSITLNGTPVSDPYGDADGGFDQANNRIVVNIGTINAGGQAVISFSVRVNDGFFGQISNQARVSGTNFTDELTDDPRTPAAKDPTNFNIAPPFAVPTLNEWGFIILLMLTGWVAVYYLRRQRKV